jgi:hypothetical protein
MGPGTASACGVMPPDTFEEALKKLGMTKSKTIERDDGGSIDITTAIATPGSSTLPMSSISTCASSPL